MGQTTVKEAQIVIEREQTIRLSPNAWRKKLPRRVFGVRLARLAVDRSVQGRGLGELLLVNALTRAS